MSLFGMTDPLVVVAVVWTVWRPSAQVLSTLLGHSDFLCEAQTKPPVLAVFLQPILTFLQAAHTSFQVTSSVCQTQAAMRWVEQQKVTACHTGVFALQQRDKCSARQDSSVNLAALVTFLKPSADTGNQELQHM